MHLMTKNCSELSGHVPYFGAKCQQFLGDVRLEVPFVTLGHYFDPVPEGGEPKESPGGTRLLCPVTTGYAQTHQNLLQSAPATNAGWPYFRSI